MLRLAAVACLLLAPSLAFAKTFPVPADNPVATVSIPSSWAPHDYDGGVEATSADGKVYIAVEVVEADEIKKAIGDGVEFFVKQGVEIDPDSMKTRNGKQAGADSFEITFSGKDKDGPTSVSMELVKTNAAKKFLILYSWGAEADAVKNGDELLKIAESLQLTK